MKNKDKYDLRVLDYRVSWNINGCGKKIEDSRTINIYNEEQLLHSKKTEKSLINYVMEWLESE